MSAALAVAWVALVLVAAWSRRPVPVRVRALVVDSPSARVVSRTSPPWTERVGRRVLALVGKRGRPASDDAARRVGRAVMWSLPAVVVHPLAPVPLGLLVWALPAMGQRRRRRARAESIARGLPEVVDLLALAVGAGYNVQLAVRAAVTRCSGPLADELARVLAEVDVGGRRLADALEELPVRAGEAVRPLVAALLASERYGAPLGASLERLAEEVRRERRRRAEEVARRLPVKLLFPLVLCTLPAFALLTVAPLIASAVRSLHF
jgi:tight adherence protein C